MVLATKPDILETIQSHGINLKKRGSSFWALCPFHSEKTPSFKIDVERQFFYCFGCQEHGDAIDFIQKFKNFSFKEALSYLHVNPDFKPALEIAKKNKKKKELINKFSDWCKFYLDLLFTSYRTLQNAKAKIKTESDLEKIAPFYHRESILEYRISILIEGSDKEKYGLYRRVTYGEGQF